MTLPLTDDEIGDIFRRVLAEDPDVPLNERERKYGPSPGGIVFATNLMAGFLIAVVRKLHGENIETERAIRIVNEQFRKMR